MRRPILIHFLGTILVGILVANLIASEWTFARHAEAGCATILRIPNPGVSRSGRTMADAVVETIHGPRVGTLRAWYRQFAPDQRVDVLYLPEEPADLYLDQFWQCYYGSVVGLVTLTVVATVEGLRFAKSRRSSSLMKRKTGQERMARG